MTHDLNLSADQGYVLASATRRDEAPAQANAVFQIVFEDLKERIRKGEWLPGDRLPSIIRLAKNLEVSTGSVREALRSLQYIGVV